MHPTASRAALKQISSIGFSGAGFLACYHLGVVSCLTDQGVLFGRTCSSDGHRSSDSVVLTGVSGGALVAAAVVAGIDVATGMQTILNVSQAARCGGRWLGSG
jgi:predicted acylesterase/phospholipase RssA